MREFSRLYGLLNLLSIDVAIGAVCCALFFGRLLQVDILPYGLITLGLTVWVIYCADHLFDAARLKGRASTRRHQFHQDHFWLLVKIVSSGNFSHCRPRFLYSYTCFHWRNGVDAGRRSLSHPASMAPFSERISDCFSLHRRHSVAIRLGYVIGSITMAVGDDHSVYADRFVKSHYVLLV